MTLLDGPERESSWATWFWLGVIGLTLAAVAGFFAFFAYAIWKGIN